MSAAATLAIDMQTTSRPTAVVIRNKAGDIIRRSHNLRGVIDYARVSPVQNVAILHSTPSGFYPVQFMFHDGSIAETAFADWRVASDWIKARRSWRWGDWRDADDANAGPEVHGHRDAVQRYYGEAS